MKESTTDPLINEHLIEDMYRSFTRFKAVQLPFSPYKAVWQRWIRS